jgi:ABC-type nitrate/sulfonate/bicarbonate transport system permease component
MMTVGQTLSVTARYVMSLLILIAIWKAAIVVFQIEPYLLPDPMLVLDTLVKESPFFAKAALYTFGNMLVGGALGIGLGLLIGGACAYSRAARWIVEPYLTVFQSFPREALFPLLIVWLGFGQAPKMVNAGLLAFFPMAIVTLHSLSDTRDDYIKLLQSWNANRWQEFVFCRLPHAVPALIGGVKLALPLALIGAVLGEFLGGNEGLGYIIVSSGSAFRVDRVFAAIIVLAAGGLTAVSIVDAVRLSVLHNYYQR